MIKISRINGISLSPNTETDDVIIALKTAITPWKWKRGGSIHQVEEWFRKRFHTDTAYSFNAGRSALLALLKSFGIGKGDEVIVQAFTCVAVPEVVMWAGAYPVYCDIDSSYNIDPAKLEKLITRKTKAVIVQHTFGIPARIREIREIADKHKIIIIEDCSHSLGATVDGKLVGSFGDAAFFSFGRDKVISSVYGGMAIIKRKNERTKEQRNKELLQEVHDSIDYPPNDWIVQQLLHPILCNTLILPLYNVFDIGKFLLVLAQQCKLLSLAVYPGERKGLQPSVFPKRMPNALAVLALNQLRKLEQYNRRRLQVAGQYGKIVEGAIYLRYPLIVNNPVSFIKSAKQKGILLGNWYHNVVDPDVVDFSAVHYRKESCPKAEEYASKIINLPTYPGMKDEEIGRVLRYLKLDVRD